MLKREEKMRENILKFSEKKVISVGEYPSSFLFVRFLYKTNFLKEHGLFFPNYKRFEDPPFLAKVLSLKPKIAVVPENVYTYRLSHKVHLHNFDTYSDILSGVEDCMDIYLKNKMPQHAKDIIRELSSREEYYKRYIKVLESIEAIQMKIDKIRHKYSFYSCLEKINVFNIKTNVKQELVTL